ncbi:MAG: translational GTPase TypA [Candidatus Taylorbacteria bacterium]|nr:translational GTPase TypA [Candidatus Taylorbacteria bacterium]
MDIRNIAIIAHVDHGKTTIVDSMMKYTGMVKDAVSMDSNTLEQERGITIYAKNASLIYTSKATGVAHKINIIDTPGHADFGSEVERVLKSIDCVLLVVDAQEGPMPQTRFVLKKSIELGLKPIVIMNKLDKPAANPGRVHDEILELFMELGADDAQLNFPVIYAVGRDGVAKKELTDEFKDLEPLFEMIIEKVPAAEDKSSEPLVAQPFNLAYDNFLGRLAVARVWSGTIKMNQTVYIKKPNGSVETARVVKLFTFEGMSKKDSDEITSGDVAMIAGLTNIYIGDTITDNPETHSLPAISIDEPTISLNFLVNDSPFAGREGKFVTSRQIRDRLEKELEVNVGLQVDFTNADRMKVYGRGELHIAILLEQMRREGFELQVSQPEVIFKDIDGKKHEPYEEVVIDTPDEFSGTIIEKLGKRKGIMTSMKQHDGVTRLTFDIPTRGLLGFRSQFVVDTKGEGIMSSRFTEFRTFAGVIEKREVGSMISMENGKAVTFALGNLQTRGVLYIGHGTEVYAGMVIGNTSKGEEMEVNPTKGKQLTNMRASGTDDTVYLTPPLEITIERGLELINEDEYLEITPTSTRIRKKYLTRTDRDKAKKGIV